MKDFTDMFGTGILVNVPYQINVDKYIEACGEKETRMSPETNKTVRISCDFCKSMFTIFVFGDDYNPIRDNAYYHYDCFMFHAFEYDHNTDKMKGAAVDFLKKIKPSIIGVDYAAIDKWINEQYKEIHKIEDTVNKLKGVTNYEFHRFKELFKSGDEIDYQGTKLIAVPADTDGSDCHVCYSTDGKPCFFLDSDKCLNKCPKCHSEIFSHTDYVGERVVFVEKDN